MSDLITTERAGLLAGGSFTISDWEAMGETAPECELIDGDLRPVSPTDLHHERAFAELLRLLGNAIRPESRGLILGSRHGLRIDEDRGIEPDIMWIPPEEYEHLGGAVFRGVPRLVVEILSPGSLARDRKERPTDLAALGVPYYWIVEASRQLVEEYELEDGEYVLVSQAGGEDRWSPRAVAGLEIDVSVLWAEFGANE